MSEDCLITVVHNMESVTETKLTVSSERVIKIANIDGKTLYSIGNTKLVELPEGSFMEIHHPGITNIELTGMLLALLAGFLIGTKWKL